MDTSISSDLPVAAWLMQAWHGELEIAALIDACSQLEQGRQAPVAVALYRAWLARTPSGHAHLVHFNLGATLSNLGDHAGAELAYRQAVALAPGFIQPRLNLGLVLERSGKIDQALDEWRWLAQHLSADSDEQRGLLIMALNHLGRVLEGRKDYAEALQYLDRSLLLDGKQRDTLHHWVFMRQRTCTWPVYEAIGSATLDSMQEATSALAMIALSDDPVLQLNAARRFVANKVLPETPALASSGGYGHRRIRIGYCSSDFSLHPVSMLMVELFELHDRENFEVHGYCWSPEDGSALRQRVIAAMDHFHRIDGLDDLAAARLIRSHEIDILVDLQGQTAGARMNILQQRPAPVQITYLGLPATTGLPSIDYVIADRFLIPECEAPHYSEHALYLDDVYQVSDRQRAIGPTPTRADCALPENTFVFCSLNNTFKYTPEVFASWLRILNAVPDSVLWLLADNVWAERNLRALAEQAGVSARRLVFAPRVAPEAYLARFRVADLFLDTFPFNAGTTANDALFAGLPVLTRCGRTFASRMAGALLTAADLPELITYTPADYERRAIELAGNPQACLILRQRLAEQRSSGRLFDTPRFTRQLESAFLRVLGARTTAGSP